MDRMARSVVERVDAEVSGQQVQLTEERIPDDLLLGDGARSDWRKPRGQEDVHDRRMVRDVDGRAGRVEVLPTAHRDRAPGQPHHPA
jgi:hypothetical protein